MRSDACQSTLLLRSKRGPLPDAEALALDAHVASCDDCRVLALAMSDFEAVASSDRQDAQRIERLAAAARQHVSGGANSLAGRRWARRLPFGQRFARALLAAAALLLFVAGASAALLVAGAQGESDTPRPALEEQFVSRAARAGSVVSRAARAAALREVEQLNSFATARGERARGDISRGDISRGAETNPRLAAATLFKEANEMRRAGDTVRATTLYRELQRRHSASPEAQLSHVSLGHLLLSAGQSSSALAQFDAALSAAAAKSVKAEALYGRALSLGRLGQSSAERGAWERLLQEFPESPYAAHARRRLGQP